MVRVRSVRRMLEDQRRLAWRLRLLEAEAAERRGEAAEGGGPGAGAVVHYGKIEAVVVGDEQQGAHLVVRLQRFSGRPPVMGPVSGAPPLVCYPTPGRTVGDYGVDEVVRVVVAAGARLAEKVP